MRDADGKRRDPDTGVEIPSYVRTNDGKGGTTNARTLSAPRSKTESIARMGKRKLAVLRQELEELRPDELPKRPKTRGECADVPRPCPFVTCSRSMFSDVDPETGSIKYNFVDPSDMPEGGSCCLDVADHGGTQLDVIGAIMNVTRERIRQIEEIALRKFFARVKLSGQEVSMREALETAFERPERGSALAAIQGPSDHIGGEYPKAGQGEPQEPEEEPREYLPRLPSIADPAVSDEQYCEAFREVWASREARRKPAKEPRDE
jgi:hypothetical protein